MANAAHHLRVVRPNAATSGEAGHGTVEDLVLMTIIFLVAALPILSVVGGIGHWGNGALGLATLATLFSGRELFRLAAARVRARSRP
jgi:hypothetical protein